jgi:hypothetical protein
VDDRIIIEQEEKVTVWNLYNDLLGTTGQRDLTLDLDAFHRPGADLSELEKTITMEEVWSIINALPSNKVFLGEEYIPRNMCINPRERFYSLRCREK